MKSINGKEWLEIFKAAYDIAKKAHEGQIDKAGAPYISHPIRVSNSFKATQVAERTVALLHDVLEDSSLTEDDLVHMGIPRFLVDLVEVLTRKPGEEYMAFIQRCGEHPITSAVKLADLEDNLKVTRLKRLELKDLERINRYLEARRFLLGEQ